MSQTSRPGLTLLRKQTHAKWREQRAKMQAEAPQHLCGSGLMSSSSGSVAQHTSGSPTFHDGSHTDDGSPVGDGSSMDMGALWMMRVQSVMRALWTMRVLWVMGTLRVMGAQSMMRVLWMIKPYRLLSSMDDGRSMDDEAL